MHEYRLQCEGIYRYKVDTETIVTKTNVCSINSDISYSENEVSNNQPIQKGEIKQLTIHDLTSVCKYGPE